MCIGLIDVGTKLGLGRRFRSPEYNSFLQKSKIPRNIQNKSKLKCKTKKINSL